MKHMDIFILNGDFNDRYINNATWIAFSIQDILSTLSNSDLIIIAIFLLSG